MANDLEVLVASKQLLALREVARAAQQILSRKIFQPENGPAQLTDMYIDVHELHFALVAAGYEVEVLE